MKLTTSPRLNSLLYNMGIRSEFDVVEHLPRRYEDLRLTSENNIEINSKVVIYGQIVSTITTFDKKTVLVHRFDFLSSPAKRLYHVIVFNRPYFVKDIKTGDFLTIKGTFEKDRSLNLVSYYKGKIESQNQFKAIYQLPEGIQNYTFSSLVKRTLAKLDGKIYNTIPSDLIAKYRLVNKEAAINMAHFPSSVEQIKDSLRHLKYEEALLFSLKSKLIREETKSFNKIKKEPIDIDICDKFIDNLPFKLTNDQYQAAEEIIKDMNQTSTMYRLLQGDVGSGKTVVCFLCLYANYLRGDQGALMAPTDALAKQHYQTALELFKNLGLRIELLVGGTPLAKKNQIQQDLMDGYIDIVIGTHALFSKGTNYSSLGLAIIDEQHRFGVNQRKQLANKGENADLLLMSATPIPRSLALSIYGDLDVSTLTSFPSSVKDIKTRIVRSADDKIFKGVDYILSQNRQVYVIAPLIDHVSDNRYSVDTLWAKYNKKYPNRVGILHGNLSQDEKDDVLNKFYNHEIDILVSTLVVEVGIDVKNASMMIIYDACNFGLASLHQLRGRIGRDGHPSFCFLTYDGHEDEDIEKLKILQHSLDGFEIAECDLKLRGPGQLAGLKQSGLPQFKYLNVYNDINIFKLARDDAAEIIKNNKKPCYKYILSKAKKEIDQEQFVNS